MLVAWFSAAFFPLISKICIVMLILEKDSKLVFHCFSSDFGFLFDYAAIKTLAMRQEIDSGLFQRH